MKRCVTLSLCLFLLACAQGCCCGGWPFHGGYNTYGGCGPGGCPAPVMQGAFAPVMQSAAAPLGAGSCCGY